MSRRHRNLGTLAAVTVLAVLTLCPPPTEAQSLAELSRAAKQKKARAKTVVWTNEDIEGKVPAVSSQGRKPIVPTSLLRSSATSSMSAGSQPPSGQTTAVVPVQRILPVAPEAIPRSGAPSNPASAEQKEPELTPQSAHSEDAGAAELLADPTPDEIKPVRTRWRTYNLEGVPEYSYDILDPYHQNLFKADYPLSGNWFLELGALNTVVFKTRRNLDFSRVFADQIAAGTLEFFSVNNFMAETLIFGAEIRRNEDAFVPANFRLRINGVADVRRDVNAFLASSEDNVHLFDAFADIRLADLGRNNFDLLFLRGGLQAFKSDFHGLVFNDAGLGGRLFGEAKKNRLRYDFAYFKLFQKNPVSGFVDLRKPSRHQVAIARLTWEDFLFPGWNSEWTFHYNRDHRKVPGASFTTDLDTFYGGASFNGHMGRWIFNPAAFVVVGHADHLEAGVPSRHYVTGWMGLLDIQYPLDFVKFRAGYAYASGDSNPSDHRDSGYDSISDGVVLFGGPLSYWVGENIKFGRGDFTRANSFFPSFRGVNEPASHINPGLQLFNGGADFNWTPRVQTAVNLNYLRFVETGAYTNRIVIADRNAGGELNVFVRWKPILREMNENLLLDAGLSLLQPLEGLEQAFQSGQMVYSTFIAVRFIY